MTDVYSFVKEIEWDKADLISKDSLIISQVPLEFDEAFQFSVANESLNHIALLIVQDEVKQKIYSYLLASNNRISFKHGELINEIQSNKDIFIVEKSEKFQEENIYKYAPKRCFQIVEVYSDGIWRTTGI